MLVSTSAASPGLIVHGDFSFDHRKKNLYISSSTVRCVVSFKVTKTCWKKSKKELKIVWKQLEKFRKRAWKLSTFFHFASFSPHGVSTEDPTSAACGDSILWLQRFLFFIKGERDSGWSAVCSKCWQRTLLSQPGLWFLTPKNNTP